MVKVISDENNYNYNRKMKSFFMLWLMKNAAGIYCSYADLYNIEACKEIGDCCGFSY